jgi:hypothetical protein
MAARALRLSGDWPQAGVGRERSLIERRQCPGLITPSCEAPPSARHAEKLEIIWLLEESALPATDDRGFCGRLQPPPLSREHR